MVRRKHRRRQRDAGKTVRTVLVVLPPLVQHDVALVVELLLGERRQQVAHAIGFHPQREVERAGRHHFPIVGAIGVRRSVEQAAGALQRREVAVIVMLGAFEHQVLEQVREAGASGTLVLRADVIPDVDGDHRQLMVLVHDDVEAVRRAFAW